MRFMPVNALETNNNFLHPYKNIEIELNVRGKEVRIKDALYQ